ncbi:MAG: site-specific integrase [Acidimicrobiales bacterium]|nr:site-specific integrase [Acidimicrobiales bacterium]
MGSGRGSIRLKREPDYWEVRAYAGRDPVTGRPRYVSRTVRGGKRQAQKLLTSLTSELDRHGPTARHTIDELLSAHIDHLETRGRGARTIEGYRTIARGVAADVTLGKTRLDKVTVKSLDDFYNRLTGRGLSPASVGRYHALLRSAFKQAMAWGWIATNPVQLATPPSVPRVGRKIATPKVVAALLAEAASSRNPENLVAFRLLAATGARRGEICGLRWSAVDIETGRIEIRAAMAQLNNRKVVEKEPKTHQIREVTVDAQTVDLLREHHASQIQLAAEMGDELSREAFVLADMTLDPTGEAPTQPNRLTQAFARIRARVPGAEEMRLHDLRHWYASTQLDAGEPLPAVAARIGDHVETLAKVYAHKGHRGDQQAADHIGNLLDG